MSIRGDVMAEEQRVSNPYDWEHEVTDSALFAGREEEIIRIEREFARLLLALLPKVTIEANVQQPLSLYGKR